MGRRRVAMKLIEKEKLRNATFQKRKNGIMKKAHELSTLCGVDCCLIVYGPNSINDLPEVWPQDRIQVRRILEKYKAKIAEKGPKKYNVTEFLKDKMNKVEAEACKLRQERLQKLYPTWDFTFNNLGEEQLRMFVATLDSKVEDCEERIKTLKKKRDIEEKQQQQQQTAELSSDKSSASNRSHLIFSHNNNNSSTAMLSAHNHQTLDFPLEFEDNNLYHPLMLQPFHPNLMPFTMITPNDSAETAFDHYDLMMREFSCPSSSWCYSSSSNNNNNYCPNYLQNSNNNILQIHDAADQIN
ncbi:hypothetical protein QN277_010366 [Acacia crassicarpa]|uniref:MADS-box domain-containing protein n=1 Tax=Acacia crassicarpa TaxID=499986 RepID=A0AAE1IPK8_9FABA|nr:hypothetical protein QN277_010366 [Acacia crassicarpa]